MKKIALMFVLAVFVPSLVLAWLAFRSISDQRIVFERQQVQLYQGVCAGIVKDIFEYVGQRQGEFAHQVETLLAEMDPGEIATRFDERLIRAWPFADVGFVVSTDGHILAPSLFSRKEAERFRLENDQFLSNQESVQVYWRTAKGEIPFSKSDNPRSPTKDSSKSETQASPSKESEKLHPAAPQKDRSFDTKQQPAIEPTEAEFRQLIGESSRGIVARFLQNRLKLLMWYRSPSFPMLIFGAQLKLAELEAGLRELIQVDVAMQTEICIALLDDSGRPVARSHRNFVGTWNRPLASVEIGEILPHWEVAAYLLNPAKLSESHQALTLTLSLLIALLVTAIAIGGWLIVSDLSRQLRAARQKTDFVSNVSHELKTPLTSIRMFSELLADGRVTEEAKRSSYLKIITSEVARLTRLINNVLDFARLERGEKRYDFHPINLLSAVHECVEAYRPPLESSGFRLNCDLASGPIMVHGDSDALAQVLVNLLSNAEKYSGTTKEITVKVLESQSNFVEVQILDRGLGIPCGCEEKIFEQFFRANDSLSSGIHGSGLGLTLARQIARAHGGDLTYKPRADGGSCFSLRLPKCLEADTQPANE